MFESVLRTAQTVTANWVCLGLSLQYIQNFETNVPMHTSRVGSSTTDLGGFKLQKTRRPFR